MIPVGSLAKLSRGAATFGGLVGLLLCVGVLFSACTADEATVDEVTVGEVTVNVALGGATTRLDASRNAFGLPAPQLSDDERDLFARGDGFFTQDWVTAPASTGIRDGLGPTFNARACASCHVLDGRGLPPEPGFDENRFGLLFRLSVPGQDAETGAPLPDPHYGDQLQDRAIPDVPAEGRVDTTYQLIQGNYGDGSTYELRSPVYSVEDLAFGPLADDVMIGPRLAPQVIGMGLLEAVPEATLLAGADPDDEDDDGISGRPNMVWNPRTGATTLGRFGWKANVATVEQQVAEAFLSDIGITSVLKPEENCPPTQEACRQAPNGGSPELTDERLESVTFYNRTLAVPALRGADRDEVREGARLFEQFSCSSCHITTLQTGASDIETLANQTIHPYTDLLLHDMGDGLADGRPDFEASGSEWRTPPLWGLGLIDDVNRERFLLHDGRARTIAEAILWHGGEAEASREKFRVADAEDRAKLLAFLEAL